MAHARVVLFLDISRSLTEKYFDVVWGCHPPPGTPQMDPQKSIFSTAQLRVPVLYDISRDLTLNRQIFWCSLGVLPPRDPPNGPPKRNFLNGPS